MSVFLKSNPINCWSSPPKNPITYNGFDLLTDLNWRGDCNLCLLAATPNVAPQSHHIINYRNYFVSIHCRLGNKISNRVEIEALFALFRIKCGGIDMVAALLIAKCKQN